MGKIDELIQKYCPDGVEYISLLKVADVLYGFPCDASRFNDSEGRPLARIRDILNGYTDTYTTENVPDKYTLNKGDLLVGMDGNFHVGQWKMNDGILCQRVCKIESNDNETTVLNGWLHHVMPPIIKTVENMKQSGTVKHLLDKDIKAIEIPVPPLPVQKEIVSILNAFTELETKLETELEMRQKQYEYYRDELLKFEGRDDVEWKPISDIVPTKRGKRVVKSELSDSEGYPVYQNSLTPLGYYDSTNCKAGTTFVIAAGAAGEIGYCSKAFWAADDCYYFDCPESLNNRFLYHALMAQSYSIKGKVRHGAIPRISRDHVDSVIIPVPKDIHEQERIVDWLDSFDRLVVDISEGLPAEIKMRHQQYEYYRDKLLTFKRLEDKAV